MTLHSRFAFDSLACGLWLDPEIRRASDVLAILDSFLNSTCFRH